MDYSGKIITKNAVEPSQTSAPGVWTLDQAAQAVESNTWPVANVPNPISRSLRFNSADSAYLNRTPASAGSRTTWTWSGWVKPSLVTAAYNMSLFGADNGTDTSLIAFTGTINTPTYQMNIYNGNGAVIRTTQYFRDPSAWYHIVVVSDTTSATAANRTRLYVNGVQVTAFDSATYPSQNGTGSINSVTEHLIGRQNGTTRYFDGYMAQVQFIDGQALDASYFGMTDPRTGAWISKPYTGTYGTNGFYLNFSDNSSTAALGTDYSGNSNTWTTNNFSVTAGAGNDSLVDVPTPWIPYNTTGDVGGVFKGNYATFNPLGTNNNATFANGNLDTVSGSGASTVGTTFGMTTGQWYAEFVCTAKTSVNMYVAIVRADTFDGDNQADEGTNIGYLYLDTGLIYHGFASDTYGSSWSTGDVIGVAFDADTRYVTFYINGVSQGAYTRIASEYAAGFTWLMAVGEGQASATASFTMNAGQRPFAYTPPAGYLSLCTTNLPEPTILDGGDYFNAVTYTGNNQTLQSITTVGFQPDLIWIKNRNASNHVLVDAVRGRGFHLASNLTNAEATDSSTQGVTAFLSNGFSVEADPASYGSVNDGTNPYVAWNWKESATAGFDIVTYTGDGVAGRTVNHNLGVAPSMVIIKNRDNGAAGWYVYHSSIGNTAAIFLNQTSAPTTSSSYWNNTSPTTSVFTVGDSGGVNQNAAAHVAYLFAAVPGFSAFGSYTGNGSSDGPFVFTGHRPAYVLIKRTDSAENWTVYDFARDSYNLAGRRLLPNSSAAEAADTEGLDLLSNGFKVRGTSSLFNTNGGTYIYMSLASNPFKYSNAR